MRLQTGQGAIESACEPTDSSFGRVVHLRFGASRTAGTLSGQGATEYLVLLAVVLVIALVGIALLGFFPGTATDAQISESQIYWKSATPIAIVEAPGAYDYTPDNASTMAYFRVRNTGAYPLRITRIYGQGGSSINETVSGPSISSRTFLYPGEEVCFGHYSLPSPSCSTQGIYFHVGSGSTGTHILNGAKTICNADGTGQLIIPGFGFEYVQYIEGQEITKRQIGSKDFVARCIGKT